MGGEDYGKNSNWEEHPFLKNVFWPHGQVNTQKHMLIPACINVFHLSSRFRELRDVLDQGCFIHGELSRS